MRPVKILIKTAVTNKKTMVKKLKAIIAVKNGFLTYKREVLASYGGLGNSRYII